MIGMTANARCLLGAASLSAIAILDIISPSPVLAQAERNVEINVPAMPMATALQNISAQSGVAINSDPDAVKQLMSRPVRGATSAREALQAAIAGTDLTIIQSPSGAFEIVSDIVVIARRDEAETSVLVRQASTSDRSGLGLRDQPRNSQVISAKMIEDQQALDITDVLRNAGGVSVQANNPNTGASYTVRGFSAAGLVNGLAGGSQYGVQSGANQPIANIERVEVLKGPDALLSGFGNLGGNVNVVTKKPSAEERTAGRLRCARVLFDRALWPRAFLARQEYRQRLDRTGAYRSRMRRGRFDRTGRIRRRNHDDLVSARANRGGAGMVVELRRACPLAFADERHRRGRLRLPAQPAFP